MAWTAMHRSGGSMGLPPRRTRTNSVQEIRDVWAGNLDEEMGRIRDLVLKYPFIAMDTEFPGVVATPMGEFRNQADFNFNLLLCNVNILKLIQLGITFFDEHGNKPPGTCCWQFNFNFNILMDLYSRDSIDMLQRSGIDFKRHSDDGIDPNVFAELLTSSGLVLCEDITWISFSSGYDFGYLLKLLTGEPLPYDEKDFYELLAIFFPHVYDIKSLMKSVKTLKGGLQEVGDTLQIVRVGVQHTAGSDSILTGQCFFKIREEYFEGIIDEKQYNRNLFGIGAPQY